MSKDKITRNKKIVESTLLYGADDNELIKCLKKEKARLILEKAKVQNFPNSREAAIAAIIAFPTKAQKIVKDSLSKELKNISEMTINEAIDSAISLPLSSWGKKENKEIMRRLFAGWCRDELDESIYSRFMDKFEQSVGTKTGDITPDAEGIEPAVQSVQPNSITIAAPEIEAALKGKKLGDVPVEDPISAIFIRGLISAAHGDSEHLDSIIASVTDSPTTSPEFVQAYRKLLLSIQRRQGLIIKKPPRVAKTPEFDPESVTALGEVVRELPGGHVFVRIVGPIIDNHFYEMSHAEAVRYYPTRGVVFRSADAGGRTLQVGDWCQVQVEYRSTQHSSHFVVSRIVSRLYPLREIPYISKDLDSLREFFSQEISIQSTRSFLRLQDGVVASVSGIDSFYQKRGIIESLDVYDSLEAYELSDKCVFVRASLSPPSRRIDLSSPLTAMKRIFKIKSNLIIFPDFSKEQISELFSSSEIMRDQKLNEVIPSLRSRLESISDLKDKLREFDEEIAEIPAVRDRIAEIESALIENISKKINEESDEISRLKREKSSVEKSLKELNELVEKKKKNFRAELKKVWEDFKSKDEKSLAELIGLADVIGSVALGSNAVPKQASALEEITVASQKVDSATQIPIVLATGSLANQIKKDAALALAAALRISGVVGLFGNRRYQLIDTLTNSVCSGVFCSVSASGEIFSISDLMRCPAAVHIDGRIVRCSLGEFLVNRQQSEDLALVDIQGINRVAPEVLLPELQELSIGVGVGSSLVWQPKDGDLLALSGGCGAMFTLNFVPGKSTFPICGNLARSLPIINADIFITDDNDLPPLKDSSSFGVTQKAWAEFLGEYRRIDSVSREKTRRDRLMSSLLFLGVESPNLLVDAMLFSGRLGLLSRSVESLQQNDCLIETDAAIKSFGSEIFADFE